MYKHAGKISALLEPRVEMKIDTEACTRLFSAIALQPRRNTSAGACVYCTGKVFMSQPDQTRKRRRRWRSAIPALLSPRPSVKIDDMFPATVLQREGRPTALARELFALLALRMSDKIMLRPWSAIALPPDSPPARELAHIRRNDKAHAYPSQTHAPQARFSRCSLRRHPTKSTPKHANRRDMRTTVFGHRSATRRPMGARACTHHTRQNLRDVHGPKSTLSHAHSCFRPLPCNQKAHRCERLRISYRTRVNISCMCKRTCVAAKIFVKPSPRMSG